MGCFDVFQKSNYSLYLCILFALLCASQVSCQQEKLYVAFSVDNVASIDLVAATWWAGLTIKMRWENGTAYMGEPVMANRASFFRWEKDMTAAGAKRVAGWFIFVPDLAQFPFDSQKLDLVIRHPSLTADKLQWVLLPNETNVSPFLRLNNWKYSTSSVALSTKNITYARELNYFEEVVCTVFVKRRIAGGIQILIAPSFALVMVFVSFWLPIKENITRISMATAALVSEVFIHVSLRNGALMNLNSLVVMDWFMFLCYFLIILAILTNVTITLFLKGDKRDQLFAKWIGSRVRHAVWFFGPGIFTFLFLPARLIWISFLCITIPTILVELIRFAVHKIRLARRARQVPQDPQSQTDSTNSEDMDDSEDIAPTPITDANGAMYDYDPNSAVLKGEMKKFTNTRQRAGSMGSIDSLSE